MSLNFFFAEYDDFLGRRVDVIAEGHTMLQDYDIYSDFAKTEIVPGSSRVNVSAAQKFTAVVKRFQVDVSSADGMPGLQVDLRVSAYDGFPDPVISGLRILKTAPPRVENVVLKGSGWAPGVNYSFATLAALGQQLRPITTKNPDTIEIHFDGPVTVHAGDLTLKRTIRVAGTPVDQAQNTSVTPLAGALGFSYDEVNHIARWTFPSLADGKYAIHLSTTGVTGGGNALDGDWINPSETLDNYLDDAPAAFLVGDGTVGAMNSEFRLNFGLLAGDYNGDGTVTSADVPTAGSLFGDGDGNGVVQTTPTAGFDDIDVREENLTDSLPLRIIKAGDLLDNDKVGGGDLAVWKVHFGNLGDVAGDITGDGQTDGADVYAWLQLLGNESAWSLSPPLNQAAQAGAAPRVTNVAITGLDSTHTQFSFAAFAGSGLQLRTVPIGGADTILITFSEDVNVSPDSLFVVGLQTANLPVLAEFSYDSESLLAKWRFEGWGLGDQYLLSLSDEVTDVEGNRLDGEWTNPTSTSATGAAISEFPSGNGQQGGWFNFVMTLLAGDANQDNLVDASDLNILLLNYGQLFSRQFSQGDIDGDGDVQSDDLNDLLADWNRNLRTGWILADFDGDFDVDDSDLSVIMSHTGMTGATWATGDLNHDGLVTMTDLDLALAQYGLHLSVAS